MDESEAKDLDETRRLLYGCLAAHRTRRWEVVGTVANAVLHHQDVEMDRDEVLDLLVELVENNGAEGREWVYSQIDRINEEANGSPPEPPASLP